jgi:hypothetical protein
MGLTNFPNGASSFGIPLMGGATVPTTTGDFYFVSSTSGSSGNDGLSSSAPLATIAQALTRCVAGRGDTILVMTGHAETVATPIAMSKNDVRLLALGRATLTGSAADIIDLTASGCIISGFTFDIASTKIAIDMAGANQNIIVNNVFLSSVGGAASHFINMATTACNYNIISENRFISNLVVAGGAITQISHINGLGMGNTIESNEFVAGRVTTANAGAVTDAIVFLAAADAGNLIRWNSFTEFNGATFTAGVRTGASTLSGAAMIYENNFVMTTAANAIVNTAGSAGMANNIANGTV